MPLLEPVDELALGEIEEDKELILSKDAWGNSYSVRYDQGKGRQTIVQITEHSAETFVPFALDAMTWVVDLPPKEALLLLTWLEHERAHLEELASHG